MKKRLGKRTPRKMTNFIGETEVKRLICSKLLSRVMSNGLSTRKKPATKKKASQQSFVNKIT